MKKVIVIDDSALIRSLLEEIINKSKEFRVVSTVPDPYIAAEEIVKHNPDVITLDIEMPKMDGLTFLEKLMRIRPLPVLIISSLAKHNSIVTLKALELGAIDYILKPSTNIHNSINEFSDEIIEKLLIVSRSNVFAPKYRKRDLENKYSASENKKELVYKTSDKIIAIGASTGGTNAIPVVLSKLPPDSPGIVIVQHMPPGFTRSFAERLNNESRLYVKEAENNDLIQNGIAFVAPGGKHLSVIRSGAKYYIKIIDSAPVNNHKPSVDILFNSISESAGINSIGIILTGMGNDGAKGMLNMKEKGSFNIAQDEKTSVVYGMPKTAVEAGAVDKILPLTEISNYIIKWIRENNL